MTTRAGVATLPASHLPAKPTRAMRAFLMRGLSVTGVSLGMAVLPASALSAQTGGTCVPASERTGREFGCFITSREELGPLPRRPKWYWHLDTYQSRAEAEAAKGERSTVVESLGRVWLFTIAGAAWHPSTGHREARIGPLPLVAAERYTAVYMEGIFQPGMQTVVHRHPGVEAWYTLEGGMCLETPEGIVRQVAGDPGKMVRAGLPMMLTGTGTRPRRSLVLILQDSSKPWLMLAPDWTPKGLCKQ